MGFIVTFIRLNSVTDAVKEIPGLSEGMAVRILKRIRELIAMFIEASKLMGSDASVHLKETFSEAQDILEHGSRLDSSLYRMDD